MADEIGTLEPGRVEPAREPRRQLFGRQSTPELRQLGEVHTVTLRQRLEHRLPPPPRTGKPVDEDERRALSDDAIFGRRTVDDELPNLHERQSGSARRVR